MAPTPAKRSKLRDDKQLITNLIKTKSDRLTFENVGRVEHFKVFKRILIDGELTNYVVCDGCGDNKLIKYDVDKGASSVTYHLQSDAHKKTGGSKQISVQQLVYKKVPAESKKKISDLIAIWCASDNRSFSTVESETFLNFIQAVIKLGATHGLVNAKELIPCAKTVRRHIESVDNEIRYLLIGYMQMIDDICCTTDHWKDQVSNIKYMTICIHYYDKCKEKLINRVVSTFEVEDGCSDTTSNNFKEKLNQLSIDNKVRVIVSDSAQSMITAFEDDDWISCSAHNLNLLQKYAFNMQEKRNVPDPIPSITALINSAKDLVTKVKQGSYSFDLKCKLKQECPTRWDTIYDMLDSVSTNFDVLEQQVEVEKYIDRINPGLLHELLAILKPLRDLRVRLCSDSKITFNRVALTYHTIQDIMKFKPKDSIPINMLKLRFIDLLPKKFKVSPYHLIATLITPEFRSFTFCSDKIVSEAKSKLNSLLQEITESDAEDDAEIEKAENSKDSDDLFSRYREKPNNQEKVEDEVRSYKQSILTGLDIECCPFKFWNSNQKKYPKLSKIAQWLLSCPATNTSSERCFSTAGNIVTPLRNALDPDIVDKYLHSFK